MPRVDPRAVDLSVSDDALRVFLRDGREVVVPLVWFPRLLQASAADRDTWELLGDGEGVHWPGLDEDISVRGLLLGWGSKERPDSAPRAAVG